LALADFFFVLFVWAPIVDGLLEELPCAPVAFDMLRRYSVTQMNENGK